MKKAYPFAAVGHSKIDLRLEEGAKTREAFDQIRSMEPEKVDDDELFLLPENSHVVVRCISIENRQFSNPDIRKKKLIFEIIEGSHVGRKLEAWYPVELNPRTKCFEAPKNSKWRREGRRLYGREGKNGIPERRILNDILIATVRTSKKDWEKEDIGEENYYSVIKRLDRSI